MPNAYEGFKKAIAVIQINSSGRYWSCDQQVKSSHAKTKRVNKAKPDILSKNDSAEIIRKKIKQFTDVTNDWMKKIGIELGFEFKLTTYVARHSFATILIRGGAPMKLASQSLSHLNLSTTERYFAGFDLEAHAEFNKALVNF